MHVSKGFHKLLDTLPGVLPSFHPARDGAYFVQAVEGLYYVGRMSFTGQVRYEKYETNDRMRAHICARTLAET